jgi:hypothetical protein
VVCVGAAAFRVSASVDGDASKPRAVCACLLAPSLRHLSALSAALRVVLDGCVRVRAPVTIERFSPAQSSCSQQERVSWLLNALDMLKLQKRP